MTHATRSAGNRVTQFLRTSAELANKGARIFRTFQTFKPQQYCASSHGMLIVRARRYSSGWESRLRREPGVFLRRRNVSVR